MTYEQCLHHALKWIKIYTSARKSNMWDYMIFQEIRDELSETLVSFGPVYAELRADAELAEDQRKVHYAKRIKFHKEDFGAMKRGSASYAETEALIDCESYYQRENDTKRQYYLARTLIERIDQVLNGIASRLKPLDKYDLQNKEKGYEG